MKKAERSYTVVLIPEGGGRIQRHELTPTRLRRLLVAAVALVVLLAMSTGYSLYTLANLPERWRTEDQLLTQQLHLANLSQDLEHVEATLERVQRLDRKLRVILGEGTNDDERTLMGVGGPSPDTDRFDEVADSESRLELARLDFTMEELDATARYQELRLHDLQAILADEASRLASTPSIWPTKGWVTSGFGMRTSPFTGSKKMHEGIDIATRLGNPVATTADGVVLFAGVKTGYGKLVIVDHGYGITSRYGHLSGIDTKPGAIVTRGSVVGRVGNTGRSTGPHLHYEVLVAGVPVNPYRYILLEDQQLP